MKSFPVSSAARDCDYVPAKFEDVRPLHWGQDQTTQHSILYTMRTLHLQSWELLRLTVEENIYNYKKHIQDKIPHTLDAYWRFKVSVLKRHGKKSTVALIRNAKNRL